MSAMADPPSNERNSVGFGLRMRGFGRKFVTRETLIFAFQIVQWTVRIAELVTRLRDGF